MPADFAGPKRQFREIAHVFPTRERYLIARVAFGSATPVLMLILVVTHHPVWAGLGWLACLGITAACWLKPHHPTGPHNPRKEIV
jgi:hypothetical protein